MANSVSKNKEFVKTKILTTYLQIAYTNNLTCFRLLYVRLKELSTTLVRLLTNSILSGQQIVTDNSFSGANCDGP